MDKNKGLDDRFKKFGTVSFMAITKTNDFIDYLEQGKVMGTQCSKCNRQFFPPRADCCDCLSSDMNWFEVDGTGKLLTYSKLSYGPLGFDNDIPYCIALVDYGEYKMFGRISNDVPENEIKVGMPLKSVANTLKNGKLNYIFEKV